MEYKHLWSLGLCSVLVSLLDNNRKKHALAASIAAASTIAYLKVGTYPKLTRTKNLSDVSEARIKQNVTTSSLFSRSHKNPDHHRHRIENQAREPTRCGREWCSFRCWCHPPWTTTTIGSSCTATRLSSRTRRPSSKRRYSAISCQIHICGWYFSLRLRGIEGRWHEFENFWKGVSGFLDLKEIEIFLFEI